MVSCISCGYELPPNPDACPRCTWPFTIQGWERTQRFRIDRITVDTNCVNSKGEDEYLNTLECWETDGRITLQRSSVLLTELKGPEQRTAKGQSLGPHPQLFTIGISMPDGDDVLAGPDMGNELRQILFPTTKNLTPAQANDVEHLRQHVLTGGRVFLTLNTRDFIKHGKQAALTRLGIWVFTPKELVALLKRLYGYA